MQDFPVELSIFGLKSEGRNVVLSWVTKTELNSAAFIVQKIQVDGKSNNNLWIDAGQIKAAGSCNSPKSYTFTDREVNAGKYQYRLKMTDNDGSFKYSNIIETVIGQPKEYKLVQNYPNPFNPETVIGYDLPVNGKVEIIVYDLLGKEVVELVNEEKAAGIYEVKFSGSKLTSGIYFYRLTAGSFTQSKKLVLIK